MSLGVQSLESLLVSTLAAIDQSVAALPVMLQPPAVAGHSQG